MALLGALLIWAAASSSVAFLAESEWGKALRLENHLREAGWQGTDAQYEQLLHHASEAAARQPENVQYGYWLGVYRWHSINRDGSAANGDMALSAEVAAAAGRIVADLHRTRGCCPTFGPVYCLAGQLEKYILGDPAGARHIRTAYGLAPGHPTVCFVAGMLDVAEGRTEDSMAKFRRCIALDGAMAGDVIDLYIHRARRPDLAAEIAKDEISALLYAAKTLQKAADQPAAAKARSEVLTELKAHCERADAAAWSLAAVAQVVREEKDYAAAIGCYRRALAMEPARTAWRLALAATLADAGQLDQAISEAEACLQLAPGLPSARKLIADLAAQRGAAPDGSSGR